MLQITIQNNDLDKIIARVKENIDEAVDEMGKEYVKEFKNKFSTKEWNGESWEQSIMNSNTLVQSGKLRDSIHYNKIGNNVEISNNEVYAGIHNEGGEIYVTEAMKRYFWAMYYQTGDDTFKWMALKSLGDRISIPKRQYIGDDDNSVNDRIISHLEKFITK